MSKVGIHVVAMDKSKASQRERIEVALFRRAQVTVRPMLFGSVVVVVALCCFDLFATMPCPRASKPTMRSGCAVHLTKPASTAMQGRSTSSSTVKRLSSCLGGTHRFPLRTALLVMSERFFWNSDTIDVIIPRGSSHLGRPQGYWLAALLPSRTGTGRGVDQGGLRRRRKTFLALWKDAWIAWLLKAGYASA